MPIDASQIFTFAEKLTGSKGRVGKDVSDAVRKSAKTVEQSAKSAAPFLTGALRESIHTTITGSGSVGSIEAHVVADSPHAVFVENGTARMAPEPFMAPAVDGIESQFYADLEAAAAKSLSG